MFDDLSRRCSQLEQDLTRIVARVAAIPSSNMLVVKLADALYRDHDSEDAVVQRNDNGDYANGQPLSEITISGKNVSGYFFSGETILVANFGGLWHPLMAGGFHFEATAAANISLGNTGNFTLTFSRGTVTGRARYGAVVSGKIVSLHWDNHYKEFLCGDSQC